MAMASKVDVVVCLHPNRQAIVNLVESLKKGEVSGFPGKRRIDEVDHGRSVDVVHAAWVLDSVMNASTSAGEAQATSLNIAYEYVIYASEVTKGWVSIIYFRSFAGFYLNIL